MYQIAIGDDVNGFTVLHGASAATPFRRVAAFFVCASTPEVTEKLEIELSGTSAQISTAIATLGTVISRIKAYKLAAYASPQYLRFKVESGSAYAYAILNHLHFETNPDGYKTRQKGSLLLSLVYIRPNFFDGADTNLLLSGRDGTDVSSGLLLYNHTDGHAAHGNTALIKPAHFSTELPAPLRIQLRRRAGGDARDVTMNVYHHPSHVSEDPFFANAPDLVGGTLLHDAAVINEYKRRYTWSSTAWTALFSYALSLDFVNKLDGRTYRPILNLPASFAYLDLYMKMQMRISTYVLYESPPVYCDNNWQRIIFPPCEIPPNQLLREVYPHHVEFVFLFKKTSGASYTIDIDQLCLMPHDYAATFLGFFPFVTDYTLIDDNHRGLHNTRISLAGSETVAHARLGSPIMLWPGSNTRLFFHWISTTNHLEIDSRSRVWVSYRPRVQTL
jgi:hypothetical protein